MISFYIHNSQMAKHAIKWRGKNINLDQTRKIPKKATGFPWFYSLCFLYRLYSFSLRPVFQHCNAKKVTNTVLFLGGMEEKDNSRTQR